MRVIHLISFKQTLVLALALTQSVLWVFVFTAPADRLGHSSPPLVMRLLGISSFFCSNSRNLQAFTSRA